MADRDVTIDILGNDKTSRATRSASDNFRRLNDDTKKFAQQVSKSGSEIIGAGNKIGLLFGKNVARGLSAAAPAIAPVLLGAALAAAPLMGATIAGAVIGGAGLGGVVGGIALAARDPRVKTAGAELGNSLLSQLELRASAFVQPVLNSIDDIQAAFNRADNDIAAIFREAAAFVRPLTSGVTQAFERVVAGVRALTDKAGPVIDSISRGIAETGDAIGDVFELLAQDGPAAATAITAVFNVLNATIRATGMILSGLTKTFGFLAKIGVFGREAQVQMIALEANAKMAAEGVNDVGEAFVNTDGIAGAFAEAVRGVVKATGDLVEENRSLYASQISAAEAMANAKKAIADNGRTLNLNTQAGRANARALENLASSLSAQYEATLKVNGAGRAADRVAASNRASFVRLASQLTGSRAAAERLANQLLGVPKRTNTTANFNDKTAKQKAAQLKNEYENIPRTITTTARVNTASASAKLAALRKQMQTSVYSMNDTFALADTGGGTYRTGGPAQVNVDQTLNVSLDGAVFYDYTARAIASNDRDKAFARKVGQR